MSDTTNDGGPAFPVGPMGSSFTGDDGYTSHQYPGAEGMTLRDYFAAKVLEGMVANSFLSKCMSSMKQDAQGNGIKSLEFEEKVEFPAYANASYRIADAMLKERAK